MSAPKLKFELPKSEWGPGPWQDEPDRLEWITAAGTPGLIVRNHAGSLCGYAAINPGHPYHGIPYNGCLKGCRPVPRKTRLRRARRAIRRTKDERAAKFATFQLRVWGEEWDCQSCGRRGKDSHKSPEDRLSAHGGITYSGGCSGEICHTPLPGTPDHVWWFGFDCAHAFDATPALQARIRLIAPDLEAKYPGARDRDVYRDIAYVKAEVEQLAGQLLAIGQKAARHA